MTIRTTVPSGVPRAARRAAAAVAAALLVCAPIALACAVLAAPAAHAAPSETGARFLALSIDSVTPKTIDSGGSDSAGTVTVSGTVRNTGDRTVSDVDVRLQRAPRITRPDGVREALGLDQTQYGTVGLFHRVTDSLDSGDTAHFTLSLPVDDPTTRSLGITRTGVYPLLVNVNGTPDYGGRARLDDARFLLPVRSLPAPDADGPASAGDSRRPTTTPVPVTMLYPLAAKPALAAGDPAAPGDEPSQPRLTGDTLVHSLEPGGRLDGMLTAVTDALGPAADPHGSLAEGLCLAVDPDLLITVDAMAQGYRITDDASDPDAGTTGPDDGAGGRAAADWLDRLRTVSSHTCTVPLPYAQADLDAVRALDSPPLTAAALAEPADIVDRILGVTSVRNLVWPSTGQMTPATASGLSARPAEGSGAPGKPAATLLLAQNAVTRSAAAPSMPAATPHPAIARIAPDSDGADTDPPGPGAPTAVLFDMPAAAALAATGATPAAPSFVPSTLRYGADHDSRAARLQDALGAISQPILHAREQASAASEERPGPGRANVDLPGAPGAGRGGADGGRSASGPPPSTIVIAPPQYWTVDQDEAAAVLELLDGFYDDGSATPRSLTADITAARSPDAPSARLADPVPGDGVGDFDAADSGGPRSTGDEHRAVSDDLVRRLGEQLPRLATLHGMLAAPGPGGETPDEYVAPLYRDMLRALSTVGRDRGPRTAAAAAAAANDRAAALRASLDDQLDAVSVLSPGSVYTLASSQSPVLVVTKNDLPMPVRVSLRIHAPEGVRIGDAEDYVIPARGSRQIQVPAEIQFSRQIDLRVRLLAPDGVPVGDQVHISLHSNAYSMVIPVLTGISGALLLFLAGRRGWHKLRGQHDRADDHANARGLPLHGPPPADRHDQADGGPDNEG